jgi:hypothetical protein
VPNPAPLNPELLFRTLGRHQVHYVMIGALAARMFGFPRVTADVDITPARDNRNLDQLASALRELDAKIYTDTIPEGLPFDCSREMLSRSNIWNLVTRAGRVDLAFAPAGVAGYEELAEEAEHFEVFGVNLAVASLPDILRMKVAADRPKDRQDALLIREILARGSQ